MTDGPPPSNALGRIAEAAAPRGLPPVHLWNPPNCGTIDIVIRADGTWMHEGSPIRRPELVRLFSTVLRKDPDGYCLVTPVEKVGIRVDDAPFVAVDFDAEGSGADRVIRFVTQVGDEVAAGPDHPIRVARDPATGEPAPYVLVRDGLEALIDRKSFYRLVELGEHARHEGARWFGLRSGGAFFPVAPSAELGED